jgi:hypothetical protein
MTVPVQTTALPRPAAVKWIAGLAWLRLLVFGLFVVLAITFVNAAQSEWLEGFRRGWVRGTGHTPSEYGYEQAGEVVGAGLIPAILSVLLLVFAARRKLVPLRMVAVVNVVFCLAQPASLLLAVPTLILAFVRSTKQYCRGETASKAPAAA